MNNIKDGVCHWIIAMIEADWDQPTIHSIRKVATNLPEERQKEAADLIRKELMKLLSQEEG